MLPILGTVDFPGKPSRQDLERNKNILRAVCEIYPDRIPSSAVIASAVALLDTYFEGALIGDPAGFQKHGKLEVAMQIAFEIKTLVQRLRRLFRRSRNSRSVCT